MKNRVERCLLERIQVEVFVAIFSSLKNAFYASAFGLSCRPPQTHFVNRFLFVFWNFSLRYSFGYGVGRWSFDTSVACFLFSVAKPGVYSSSKDLKRQVGGSLI